MQAIILGFSCLIGGFVLGYWIDEIFHKDKPSIKEMFSWVLVFCSIGVLTWTVCGLFMYLNDSVNSKSFSATVAPTIKIEKDTVKYYFIGYATKTRHFGGFYLELKYPSVLIGDDVYDTMVKNLRDRGIKINNSDCAITSIYQFKNKEEYENFKK